MTVLGVMTAEDFDWDYVRSAGLLNSSGDLFTELLEIYGGPFQIVTVVDSGCLLVQMVRNAPCTIRIHEYPSQSFSSAWRTVFPLMN